MTSQTEQDTDKWEIYVTFNNKIDTHIYIILL